VTHEGELVLLDANRTPAVSGDPAEHARQGAWLAKGLDSLASSVS